MAQAAQADLDADLNNLVMGEAVEPLYAAVKKFIAEDVEPRTPEYFEAAFEHGDRWSLSPRQEDILGGLKAKAKANGLWNFFLPDADTGEGLKNLDYAYIAAELGKNPIASECLNCSAPDTGNMEVLERYGTEEQKEQWLKPLLAGEIRSAYAMTEPNLASSDAKQIATQARLDGDEWVLNGEKFYISGAGDSRCKIMITMVQTNPDAPPHRQQSQILVPKDTPGVEIIEPMTVFGHDDAPHGHMHLRFDNARVPKENMLLGEGRGFEISQRPPRPRPHPPLHAIGRPSGARLGFDGAPRHVPRSLRAAAGAVGQEPGAGLSRPHRDRSHAADGAEGRQGHGRARQPRSQGVGSHVQGHDPGTGLPDHRPGHSDPWCVGRIASGRRLPACTPANVRCALPTARRSSPLGGRPPGIAPLRRKLRARSLIASTESANGGGDIAVATRRSAPYNRLPPLLRAVVRL